ncbi:VOC family protein [Halomonas stenophila]|uniref:Catechol 2,3-dioxygenase-like lactoylglutathione lyase family enzyme n=1 Tax=Halomonas stenophila TaxID=795312 RepID=A0A7W5EWC0_9GAMM|nr:VOC family protein [Halomonas stenophila]MBB3232623.1 catechol 2,3-dioxygenase-like lactoylglutathione lyase family enzyme [Halomonas stenophila]
MINTAQHGDGPALQIDLLVLRCKALEASKRFYELLGFCFVKEQHGDGPIHYASQEAGMVFELYPWPEDDVTDHTRLGFSVPNLGEIVANIETLSRHVIADEVVYIAQDPDGRKIELTERTT